MVGTEDVGMFFLGVFGALLTVYVTKRTLIPEFPPLLDVSSMETEVKEIQLAIKRMENRIEEIQKRLAKGELSEAQAERLKFVLNNYQEERDAKERRQRTLEPEIRKTRRLSKAPGVVVYIVLGGVFAAMLAGRIQVEGLDGDLPEFLAAFVIGATWMSYISVLGLRGAPKKAMESLEQDKLKQNKEIDERFRSLEANLKDAVRNTVAKAEIASPVPEPKLAEDAAEMVSKEFDLARKEVGNLLNLYVGEAKKKLRVDQLLPY